MLPSMPILFSRESQDAFGNKIQPSTSFFHQHLAPKPVIPEPEAQKPQPSPEHIPKATQNEIKNKIIPKKKDELPKANVLETALVKSYYTKVQSRFSSNTSHPTNKFVLFQHILKSFNPHKETPVDLYRKIEQLFGEEHKDIVEEFLLFLKPGQSAEVGRLMDRLMLVQLTSFIEMLQNTFARKPTVFRKILRAITTGINSGSSEGMKNRVLPHLRSNPRLTQLFKSLFPDERPPDSAYETGTDVLNESFLTNDKGYDVWEFAEEGNTKRNLDAKERLDTVYLQGRVFVQHGRLLRPACVSYPFSKEPYRVHARRLAPPHCHLSPSDSDDEHNSKRKTPKITPKKGKKPLKSPTKSNKDVNDNTKHKECTIMSPKPNKKANNISKTKCKKEIEVLKRERKDSKNQMLQKNDSSKAKQPKLETVVSIELPKLVTTVSTELPKLMTPVSTQTQLLTPIVTHKCVSPVRSQRLVTTDNGELPKFVTTISKESSKLVTPIRIEKNIEIKSSSWTRDEDKTMLQVMKGEAGSEQVFGRIRELLPHRSSTEIKERFYHVMTLLQQMAVGEVT